MVRRLLSPFIVDHVAADRQVGSLEAATLFADVAGFSALTSALMEHGQYGAEVVAQVMTTLFSPLVDAVYSHGGAITGFAGDSFTALFATDEVDGGDGHVVRALAAATAMRQHLDARGHYDTPWGGFDIGVKIGLAVGTVDWRILRQRDERAAYYVRGAAIDGCAAIDGHAEPGDLVLHPSSRSLLRDAVTIEEISDSAEDGGGLDFARVLTVATTLPDPEPLRLPPIDTDTLAAFLPAEVIEQTEVGEYRNVVNVFINLQGDPDDDELRSIVQVIRDLQTSYGGQLNRVAFGDKGCNLLLFWGAPVSFENDVERALHFLVDLQRAVTRPLRAGVTRGVSFVGFVGSDAHAEYTCYGLGINLAARLMTSAPWGAIWMDAAVHRRATAEFVTSSIGERPFKGFTDPQQVFAVSDRRVEVQRRFGGDMVGREVESAALASFVAPVNEGRFAGVLVVHGEAGMGKSRLVGEFLESLDGSRSGSEGHEAPSPGLRAVIAPADAIARRPFNPFRYWLRNRFARDPRAPDHENKAAFDQRFDELLAAVPDDDLRQELDRVRSILGALVDLQWEGSLSSQLDPRSRYEHTLDAIALLLLAESLCRPVLLVLEDVHWIDEGSAEVVRRLVHEAAGTSERHDGVYGQPRPFPLAVLATAREVEDTTFSAAVEHQRLVLSPFGRSDVATLSTLILGDPPAPELLDLVESRASGNPFFAEQLVHHLRNERLLQPVAGHWTLNRAALADAPLPTDVKIIFVAQLDRLGQAAREVAQAASVLGREFSHYELLELLGEAGVARSAVGPAIEAGRAAGIWAPVGTTRWAFRHILLRDAAYDVQIRVRRAAMHHRAGMVLERIWHDDIEPHYVDISHHYESACHLGVVEARGPAADYLTKAGMQAATSFANASAADLFTRALALVPDDDVPGRFTLLLEREWANDVQGERAAQVADIAALESLALHAGDLAMQTEASLRRSYVSGDLADFEGALAASDRTIELARLAGLPDAESTALRTGGASLRAMGRLDEALERFEQALAVAQSAGLEYQEATAWTAWSALSARRGQWRAAASALEGVSATFERMGLIVRRSHALSDWGIALSAGGVLGEAELRLEQALALVRDAGDVAGQIPPLYSLAPVLLARGDFHGADGTAAEAARLAERIGNSHLLSRALMERARVAVSTGDRQAAHDLLAESRARDGDVHADLRSPLLAYQAALALLDGHPVDALELAAEAVELARAVDDRLDCVVAVLYRSLAEEELGQTTAADAGFREVIEIERAMDAVPGRTWDGHAGLVRLLHQQGRTDAALDAAQPIIAHLMGQDPGPVDHGLGSCEQPLRVHLSVARTLMAVGDGRADAVVEQASTLLTGWADVFDEPHRRQQLLEIPYHHDIVQMSQRQWQYGDGHVARRGRTVGRGAVPPDDPDAVPR